MAWFVNHNKERQPGKTIAVSNNTRQNNGFLWPEQLVSFIPCKITSVEVYSHYTIKLFLSTPLTASTSGPAQ